MNMRFRLHLCIVQLLLLFLCPFALAAQSASSCDIEGSVLIIIDKSASMSQNVNGRTRWTYVRDAVQRFVQALDLTGTTRVCVTTFSSDYQVLLPEHWTNDDQEIIDSLAKVAPAGGTQYRLPFDANAVDVVGLFHQRPSNLPKYAIMITDGYPTDFASDADAQNWAVERGNALSQQGIRFFNFTLSQDSVHRSLRIMSSLTGGTAALAKEEELADRLTLLITTVGGELVASADTVYCGEPDAFGMSYGEFRITAGADATKTVTSVTLDDGTYFSMEWSGSPPPFTLSPSGSFTFRVRFTQGAERARRTALLTVNGSDCPVQVTLVGGALATGVDEAGTAPAEWPSRIVANGAPLRIRCVGTGLRSVVVTNMSGAVVHSTTVHILYTRDVVDIPMPPLPSGAYLVTDRSTDGLWWHSVRVLVLP